MKHSLTIPALLAAGLCLAAGCGSKNKVDLSSSHTTAAETMAETTEAAPPTVEETEPAADSSRPASGLSTSVETYSSGDISIQYPVVANLNNSETEDAVNALLKSNAISIIKAQGLDETSDHLEIQCEILSADRNRLTAVYKGELSAGGAAHPVSVFYTNTVDMGKAADIGFSTYADPHTMAGYVMSDACEFTGLDAETEQAVKEYKATQTIDSYTKLFQKADFPLKGTSFPESFSYEDKGAIYFSIPVPHALGDYAIVEFTPETK